MNVLRFIIYGNILVSLSVGSITLGVGQFLELELYWFYAVCSSLATLFIYNLQRLLRFNNVSAEASDRHNWLIKHKMVVTFLCFIGGAGALITYLVIGINQDIIIILLLSSIGVLYALNKGRFKALRDLPYVKIYLIAFVWTMVCVFWPAFREQQVETPIHTIMVGVLFYIIAATIPFDIRDLNYDSPSQKTIPLLIGIAKSKVLASLLVVVSGLALLLAEPSFLYSPTFYTAYVGMLILILFTQQSRKEMYFSGLIDGWIILLGIAFITA